MEENANISLCFLTIIHHDKLTLARGSQLQIMLWCDVLPRFRNDQRTLSLTWSNWHNDMKSDHFGIFWKARYRTPQIGRLEFSNPFVMQTYRQHLAKSDMALSISNISVVTLWYLTSYRVITPLPLACLIVTTWDSFESMLAKWAPRDVYDVLLSRLVQA